MELSKVMILLIDIVFFLCLRVSKALDCQPNNQNPYKVAYNIVVDKSGSGNFTTIQSAIDSIPSQSSQWIRVQISQGVYGEKVNIPSGKTCIFLDGAGQGLTEIQWNDHTSTASSATFTSLAENLAVRGITFRNTYNAPGTVKNRTDIAPALAVLVEGDKSVFYQCNFIGLQDTLWDGIGRHYYLDSYIEGVIDIISGAGQSIFERCKINVTIGMYAPVLTNGYITAQGRDSETETNGFVFKRCRVIGSGSAYLGRAYRPFSTVIFYASYLSGLVNPAGWDAWDQSLHEGNLTFAEVDNVGEGADTSKRVDWRKTLNADQIGYYVHPSYIDQEGWISRLPQIY